MPDKNLEEILARLRADDSDVLRELFKQHYLFICTAIHRFIKEPATVEDVAQEVFIKFWQKRHQLQINSSFQAYLRRMAINEAISYLRKKSNVGFDPIGEEVMPEKSSSGEDQLLEVELMARVKAAVNLLPPQCRLIFQLSRYEELSYREIADKLDISIKTVENQMVKALKIVRKQLRGYLKS